MSTLHLQPDSPGALCPCCGQRWPDEDGDALKFVKANAGRHPPIFLAQVLKWPLERLERLARRKAIDLTYRPEVERS